MFTSLPVRGLGRGRALYYGGFEEPRGDRGTKKSQRTIQRTRLRPSRHSADELVLAEVMRVTICRIDSACRIRSTALAAETMASYISSTMAPTSGREFSGSSTRTWRQVGMSCIAAALLVAGGAYWLRTRPYGDATRRPGQKPFPTVEAYSAWLSTFENTQLHKVYMRGMGEIARRDQQQLYLWGAAAGALLIGAGIWFGLLRVRRPAARSGCHPRRPNVRGVARLLVLRCRSSRPWRSSSDWRPHCDIARG